MKLCSLYIENFGGLSGFEMDFEAGLTTLNRPNGFGKTTLAEFIRAMFYGFPRKTKTREKSKRQKYTPWSGGKCGGNLVFEYEGQRYRIERTFGATPKADTFTLIDLVTNRKSQRFSAEIGIELFGLDSDSFERSVYLPQLQEDETLTTASIQAKLTNLVEDSSDVGNYDKAMALLRAKRSALIPYRGNGGTVAEAAAQMTRLQLQLDQAQLQYERLILLRSAVSDTAQKLEESKRELVQLQQKLAEAAEAAAQLVHRDRYHRLKQECGRIETQISVLQAGYPGGFPEIPELSAMEVTADKLAVLENQIMPVDAAAQLPTQEELDDCHRKCAELETLQQELRAAEETLAVQMQKEREFLDALPEQSGNTAVVTAWMLCVLGTVAGIALVLVKQVLFGSIGMGIGVLAMLTACLLMQRRKKNRRARAAQRKQESDRRVAAAQQRIAALRRRSEQYCAEIAQFFSGFGMEIPPRQFPAGLARLEHQLQYSGQVKHREAELATYRKELADFFTRCGLVFDGDFRVRLRQMRDDRREMQALLARKHEVTGHLEQLEREHPEILMQPATAVEDVQPLRQQEKRLRETCSSMTETLLQQKQELQHLQTQTEQIPSIQDELARLQGQMAEDREKARILDETMILLQQARERLSTNYMDTIRSRFGWYMTQLEASCGEQYLIDTDFQVYPERMGQMRELAYFSAGQTDLVMLCMRLALVDALFREENMFVILDDPFVNLDDAHMAQGCKLLRNLAAKRQILYLTCHSSRSI